MLYLFIKVVNHLVFNRKLKKKNSQLKELFEKATNQA